MGSRPSSSGEPPRKFEQSIAPVEPPATEPRGAVVENASSSAPLSAETKGEVAVWVRRMLLVLEVVVAVWAGMLLAVLPWTPVWTSNHMFLRYPGLKLIFLNNFMRGMLTGLGLVDIWIGVWDAVHYRDTPPGSR